MRKLLSLCLALAMTAALLTPGAALAQGDMDCDAACTQVRDEGVLTGDDGFEQCMTVCKAQTDPEIVGDKDGHGIGDLIRMGLTMACALKVYFACLKSVTNPDFYAAVFNYLKHPDDHHLSGVLCEEGYHCFKTLCKCDESVGSCSKTAFNERCSD